METSVKWEGKSDLKYLIKISLTTEALWRKWVKEEKKEDLMIIITMIMMRKQNKRKRIRRRKLLIPRESESQRFHTI